MVYERDPFCLQMRREGGTFLEKYSKNSLRSVEPPLIIVKGSARRFSLDTHDLGHSLSLSVTLSGILLVIPIRAHGLGRAG